MYINKHLFWKYAKHGAKNELDNSAMETSLPKLQTFFVAEDCTNKMTGKGGGAAQSLKKKVFLKRGRKGRPDNLFN